MINESAVNKHFKKVWAKSKIYVEHVAPTETFPSLYLISDNDIILRVQPGLKLFNDRGMFPEMPPIGKIHTYGKLCGCKADGPSMQKLIADTLNSEGLKELEVSPWQTDDAVLLYHGQKHTFLDRKFLDLLEGDGYKAYGTAKPGAPVMFTAGELTADQVFAVMAPMRICFDNPETPKFPNIPELITDVTP
jgi:hypothetical protein